MDKNLWLTCERLVIVFPYRNEDNFKEYRLALDNLLNASNVKELKIIVTIPEFVKKEELKEHKLITYFSPKEISMFGKIKDPELTKISGQSFDAMLWLETEDKKIAKYLSKMDVGWKIGINTPFDFYTIKVNCKSQKPSEIINFARLTLEKISTCELVK